MLWIKPVWKKYNRSIVHAYGNLSSQLDTPDQILYMSETPLTPEMETPLFSVHTWVPCCWSLTPGWTVTEIFHAVIENQCSYGISHSILSASFCEVWGGNCWTSKSAWHCGCQPKRCSQQWAIILAPFVSFAVLSGVEFENKKSCYKENFLK